MKIDRVIFTLNNNPKYVPFWNVNSYVWKHKFKIQPTLIFNGTKEELDNCSFSFEYGDFLLVDRIEDVSESSPDWSVTWALFWAATQFPEETCVFSGIDQIPIGNLFFEKIKEIEDEKLVVGFADAYKKYTPSTLGYFNTVTNVLYPSSHLVGKGKLFKEIFEIDDSWETEIRKVYNSKSRYHLQNNFYRGKLWGLDECYASEKISIYNKPKMIHYLEIFWDYWFKNRIDLQSLTNNKYDLNLVKEGYYSEFTTKKFTSDKLTIDSIVDNIQEY